MSQPDLANFTSTYLTLPYRAANLFATGWMVGQLDATLMGT